MKARSNARYGMLTIADSKHARGERWLQCMHGRVLGTLASGNVAEKAIAAPPHILLPNENHGGHVNTRSHAGTDGLAHSTF